MRTRDEAVTTSRTTKGLQRRCLFSGMVHELRLESFAQLLGKPSISVVCRKKLRRLSSVGSHFLSLVSAFVSAFDGVDQCGFYCFHRARENRPIDSSRLS